MTSLQKAFQHMKNTFEERGIESAETNASWILMEVLNLNSSSDLILKRSDSLSVKEQTDMNHFVKARLSGKPLQYVLESTEFYGLKLKLNSNVLIPRPETENLVQHCLSYLETLPHSASLLELGTGSGAIAIALAKFSRAHIHATDISETALLIAKENATTHQVLSQIQFEQKDLFDGIKSYYDLIVSNPPYISKLEMENLPDEIKNYEPHQALCGGLGGLEMIEKIAHQAYTFLNPQGRIYLEFGGSGQTESLRQLFKGIPEYTQIEIHRDLSGNDRILEAVKGSA